MTGNGIAGGRRSMLREGAGISAGARRRLVDVRQVSLVADDTSGARKMLVSQASMHIDVGEIVALIGRSGSGKTLLSQAIAGALPEGVRRAGGHIARPEQPGGMHTVFQCGRDALDPFSTVERIIGRILARAQRSPGVTPCGSSVMQCLRLAGLSNARRFLSRHAFELSGGEARRVALACAFASSARLIIADEPTTGLDPSLKIELAERLSRLRRDGRAILVVTHAIGLFLPRVDRIYVLDPEVRGICPVPRSARALVASPARPLLDAAARLTAAATEVCHG